MSVVQSFGIELLEVFDALRQRDKREQWRADTLRLVVMIRDQTIGAAELFPDWFPPKVVEAGSEEHEQAIAAGVQEDLSEVTWMSPSAGVDDEWREIQRQLADSSIEVQEGPSHGLGGKGGWL